MFYYMSIDKNILLGKEEVVSSNLIVGSIIRMNIFSLNFSGFKN